MLTEYTRKKRNPPHKRTCQREDGGVASVVSLYPQVRARSNNVNDEIMFDLLWMGEFVLFDCGIESVPCRWCGITLAVAHRGAPFARRAYFGVVLHTLCRVATLHSQLIVCEIIFMCRIQRR